MATSDRIYGVNGSLGYKAPCRVATSGNVTLSGLQTIGTLSPVALQSGDAVCVRAQNDSRDNGVYIASTGEWQRRADFNGGKDIVKGTQIFVTGGDFAGLAFYVATSDPIEIGVSQIVIAPSPQNYLGYATIFDPIFAGGARGNNSYDDSPAFAAAAASGLKVVIPGSGFVYKIGQSVGTFAISSGTELSLANATVNMSMDAVGREDRGFWFQPGCVNASITGTATINASNSSSPFDGSYGCVFTFGRFSYGSGGSASLTARNRVEGNIVINGLSPMVGNLKGIGIFGRSEENYIRGVRITGSCTFYCVQHWGSDRTQAEREAGILPTKTWHPNNNVIEDVVVEGSHPGSNAFVCSAVGRTTINRCLSIGVPEPYFMFVGDFGYSYAQNLGQKKFPQISIIDCDSVGAVNYVLSIDMQSNPVNLFAGSPVWTSADRDKGGHVHVIGGFDASLASGDPTVPCVAVTGLHSLVLRDIKCRDTDDANTRPIVQAFGCNSVIIDGGSEFISNAGMIFRNCDSVVLDINNRTFLPKPDEATRGISVATDKGDSLVVGAVSAGATQITLDSAAIVAGAGGYIRYDDGMDVYDIKMLSSSFANIDQQTIKTEPVPVSIPNGATVTLIHTVNDITIRGTYDGFSEHLRFIGDADAKIGNIFLDHPRFLNGGIYDVEVQACKSFVSHGAFHDHGGQRTTTDDKRGYLFGADVESYKVTAAHFGPNNEKLRYLIYADDAATNGYVDFCTFDSYNAAATNPACIFRDQADMKIGDNNSYADGLVPIYPNRYPSFTPVFYGSSTAGTPGGTFLGEYTVKGDQVSGTVTAAFSSLTGMTGNLMMNGLPYEARDSLVVNGGLNVGKQSGKTNATDVLSGYVVQNSDTIAFTNAADNGSPWAIADMTSSMNVSFSFSYTKE